MRSVADDLRSETREAAARLTADQRIALAMTLGDDDVAMYRAMHRLTDEAARTAVRRTRAVGRIPSRSNDPDPA